MIIWFISSSSSYVPHTNKFYHINYVDLCFYPNLSQKSNTFLKHDHDDDDQDGVVSIFICIDDITQPIYKSIYVIWTYILSWDWARNVRKRRIRIRKLKTKKEKKHYRYSSTKPQFIFLASHTLNQRSSIHLSLFVSFHSTIQRFRARHECRVLRSVCCELRAATASQSPMPKPNAAHVKCNKPKQRFVIKKEFSFI